MSYIIVGIGGMIGALLRYYVGHAVSGLGNTEFPSGTFIINLLGCLVLGWFNTWGAGTKRIAPWMKAGFGTGLVGSFTTFSTFSVESVHLLQENWIGLGFLYIFGSLIGGLMMTAIGARIAETAHQGREG